MLDKKASDTLFDFAIWRVLGEPVRVSILRFLSEKGPSDISSIAQNFSQDRSVISRHLQTMERAAVLRSEKVSRRMVYSINGQALIARLEEYLAKLKKTLSNCCT